VSFDISGEEEVGEDPNITASRSLYEGRAEVADDEQ
jgi:hypothetical protein